MKKKIVAQFNLLNEPFLYFFINISIQLRTVSVITKSQSSGTCAYNIPLQEIQTLITFRL